MRSAGSAYRRGHQFDRPYDAVVVGSGMGGLSAAVMLARSGKSVLVLEQNAVIGGMTQSYSRGSYRWTVGLHYIGDVASRRTLTRKLFDYVTASQVEWADMPSIFNRMVIADREYQIPAGEAAYAAALKKAFPHQADAIDTYLGLVRAASKSSSVYFAQKALPQAMGEHLIESACGPFYDFADRLTIDALRDLFDDEELIAVLCANWGDYSLEPTKSSFALHCMLAKHYMNGGSYPIGGGAAFADAMVPIIEQAGGTVLHSADVASICVTDGKAHGVRLVDGTEINCATVISNAGVQNSFGRLLDPDVAKSAGLDALLSEVKDTYAIVGLNIGFNKSAEELGFTPANIWDHPSADFQANLDAHRADFDAAFPWTFITFPSTKDPSLPSEFANKATVEMYAYTDYRHFEHWADTRWMKRGDDYQARKADIQKRLLERLFHFVPAARDAVDVVEVSTPLTYETFAKRQKGGFMGMEGSPARFRQNWLRARTPIDGLWLTGQDVATDGVIGALMGGVICASAVLERDLLAEIRLTESDMT
jgi:all-trans-retinol 13,14-reductase